jgi:3-oxoacyl-ACP reductase-like protein
LSPALLRDLPPSSATPSPTPARGAVAAGVAAAAAAAAGGCKFDFFFLFLECLLRVITGPNSDLIAGLGLLSVLFPF